VRKTESDEKGDNSVEDQGSEQEEDSSDDSGEEEASQPRELFGITNQLLFSLVSYLCNIKSAQSVFSVAL
jgi:hypothetical protein